MRNNNTPTRRLENGSLALTLYGENDGGFCLWDMGKNERLVQFPHLGLLAPVFNGAVEQLHFLNSETEDDEWHFMFNSELLSSFCFWIKRNEQAFDFGCNFSVKKKTVLNRLEIFPENTQLNMYNLINFRNIHGSENMWPELLLASPEAWETTTYSDDWQFAPHPDMFIFTKQDANLFCGTVDLSASYGLRFRKGDKLVAQEYSLLFGENEYGVVVEPDVTFTSPQFRLFLQRGKDPYTTVSTFADMLVKEKKIADPKSAKREAWWYEPLYCTWIDQCLAAKYEVPVTLEEQTATSSNKATAVLTEKLVLNALDIIKQENLPFRSILLDEGWSVARGHWEAHPERFPDLRKLVDILHAENKKVIVWWNWCEIAPEAESHVKEEHKSCSGKRNRHGAIMRDYSLKATQEEYLKPLFYKLFSSAPGCYNLDGIKTDFQADKVHFDLPASDPSWRGEQNYFQHIYKLFYSEMKKHKPDAVHIGCAGNFHLSEYIDINRTYDVTTSNTMEHENRAKMLYATNPGNAVAYDFHCTTEKLAAYFQSAARTGSSVQIGNLLYCRDDWISKPRVADAGYYQVLRQCLNSKKYL